MPQALRNSIVISVNNSDVVSRRTSVLNIHLSEFGPNAGL